MLKVGNKCFFRRSSGKQQLATIFSIYEDSAIVKWVGHDGVSIGTKEIKINQLKPFRNKINFFNWFILILLFLILSFLFYDHYSVKKKVIISLKLFFTSHFLNTHY
jgi:hypothetical protein